MKQIDKLLHGSSPEGLHKRSENVLAVFTSTLKELADINGEALDQKAKKEDEMAALREEIAALDKVHARNAKVVAKINEFLE